MNKKSKVLIIFALMVIILTILYMIQVNNSKYLDYVEIDNYLIHYYDDEGYLYDLETKNDGILVRKKVIINCIDAPCDPPEIKKHMVKYQKEYVDLIMDLFENRDSKEINIWMENLNSNQFKLISKIVNR